MTSHPSRSRAQRPLIRPRSHLLRAPGETRRLIIGVVACAILASCVALGVAMARPVTYQAQATVDLRRLLGPDSASFQSVERAEREATNQVLLAQSTDIVGQAAQSLNISPQEATKSFSVKSVSGTDAILLQGIGRDAQQAAERAMKYAQTYIAYSVQRRATALELERRDLAAEIQAMESVPLNPGSGYTAAVRNSQLQALAQRMGEVMAAKATLGPRGAQPYLIQAATPPTAPSGPPPWVWGAAAGLMTFVTSALLLGVLLYRKSSVSRGGG